MPPAAASVATETTTVGPSDPIVLPVELVNGHILVEATADGRPITLIVDTGSSSSTLDAAWAESAGIRPLGGLVDAVGTGRVKVALAKVGHLGIGGIGLPDVTVALLPLDAVVSAAGRVVHGTLGYDLFARHVVAIDYAGRALRVWPREAASPGGGISLALDLAHRVPVIRATLRAPGGAPVEGRLIVDLGSSSLGVRLSARFVAAHEEAFAGLGGYETSIGVGIGGLLPGKVGRLEELTLGSIGLSGPTVGIPAEDRGALALPRFDGTVGVPVLERLAPIVDYAQSRIILRPGVDLAAPFAADASGLVLDSPAPEFGVARVRLVATTSPAAEVGIESGDEIVAVDGAAVAKLGLSRVRELLRDAGVERRLLVHRGFERREVRVGLRALV